jgi:hypothetical protein
MGGMDSTPTYTRVKAKCLDCTLHFVLCTWHPERHSPLSLHCPECGQHRGRFLVWREPAVGSICAEVPGRYTSTDALPASALAPKHWWQFWKAG